MFTVLMTAGPGLEFTVSGREEERETPASLGVCRVRGGLEGRPLVMEHREGTCQESGQKCPGEV